jgi:uncharacterized RDD family membrane protein YckC
MKEQRAMASQTAVKPDRFTGLPPGVAVGPLGLRLVAHLIDAVVPAVLVGVVAGAGEPGVQALDVIALVLLVVWALVLWWMFATRAAGPGMRLMKLQLVGFRNGRPIGWGRFFVRAVVLGLLSVTGVGLVLMLFFLLRHPRYQGWHDLVADSVVIEERMLAPRNSQPASAAATPAPRSGEIEDEQRPLAPAVAAGPMSADTEPGERTELIPPPTQHPSSAPPTQSRSWTAVLDDGREVPVGGLVLLGRNPQPRPGEETAELVKLADETRTVSKSHLALQVVGDDLVVTDRGSTNGSTITTTEGVTTACTPEKPVPVAEGSVVSMGDHWLTVRLD